MNSSKNYARSLGPSAPTPEAETIPTSTFPRISAGMLTPFGVELRKLRIENRMRIYDLAQDLGVSSSSVSAWETGRRDIREPELERIGDLFKLNEADLSKLRKAAEISRTRVVIEAHSPDARMLANTLKKKINLLSPDAIRELMQYFKSGDRRRSDRRVRTRSIEEIAQLARTLREGMGYKDHDAFDVVGFYDFSLAKIFAETLGAPMIENIRFEIWDDAEMPSETVAMASIRPPHIVLSNSIYEDAANKGERGRWIMSHELGHIFLLHGIDSRVPTMNPRGPEYFVETVVDASQLPEQATLPIPFEPPKNMAKIPYRQSAESQADEFAAELLMPGCACGGLHDHHIALRFGVSRRNARKRLKFLAHRDPNFH